jgi:hypothetical protein
MLLAVEGAEIPTLHFGQDFVATGSSPPQFWQKAICSTI